MFQGRIMMMNVATMFHSMSLPKDRTKEKKKIVKQLVSLFSSGNVSLQSGRYITEEDVEKMRKDLLR